MKRTYLGGAFILALIVVVPNLPQMRVTSDVSHAPPAPTRLIIPAIHVDASIERVGLTLAGAMDAPERPANVAWYELGTRPGEQGSAVIAGHSGWRDAIPAVFDNLGVLKKGDLVSVVDDTGATVTFVVREKRIYDPNADTSGVFGSNDGKAHLNLITCEGVWDPATKSSSKRLVIFADKQ